MSQCLMRSHRQGTVMQLMFREFMYESVEKLKKAKAKYQMNWSVLFLQIN